MEDYNISHKGHQISHILYTNLIVRQMRKLSMRVTEANTKILFLKVIDSVRDKPKAHIGLTTVWGITGTRTGKP